MLWLNVFNVELFTKRKTELKSLVCRVVLTHFEGMAGLNVTDVRREIIPLLWNIVRERALAIFFFFFFFKHASIQNIRVSAEERSCQEWVTQWEGQRDKQDTSPRSCDILLAICNLFWLGPTTSEELEEEVAPSSLLLTGR